jgi:hypothetical protein
MLQSRFLQDYFRVGREFKFITNEKLLENQDKRLLYMFGLIGIILFSVPGFVKNLRDIKQNKS